MTRPFVNSEEKIGWQLVVSDLDGTLLDSQGRISAENQAAVAELAAAGLGVAMGNASQAALAASQYQTAHHDESGFAAGIRRFILRPAFSRENR